MKVAAAAVAALLLPAVAGARSAPPPPGFFGVAVSGPVLDGTVSLDRELRRMHRSGADQITVALNWVDVEPNGPPSVVPDDWSRSDRIVAAAAAQHLRVLPVVVQAPPWARLDPTRAFSPPADPSAYGAFVGDAAARYGSTGTFWRSHPDLPRLPIRDWQIWNEPSGGDGVRDPSVFWADEAPWEDRYVAMLKASHAALLHADPLSRTLLGGLLGLSWEALGSLYDHGAGPYFDVAGLHPYTGHAASVDDIVLFCRRVLDEHGDTAKRIVLTEVGWPSSNAPDYKAAGAAGTAYVQGNWARTALGELTRKRNALRIDSLFWFTWMTRDADSYDAFDYSGLTRLTPGGEVVPKPSLGVYRQLALAARRARKRRTPTQPTRHS